MTRPSSAQMLAAAIEARVAGADLWDRAATIELILAERHPAMAAEVREGLRARLRGQGEFEAWLEAPGTVEAAGDPVQVVLDLLAQLRTAASRVNPAHPSFPRIAATLMKVATEADKLLAGGDDEEAERAARDREACEKLIKRLELGVPALEAARR